MHAYYSTQYNSGPIRSQYFGPSSQLNNAYSGGYQSSDHANSPSYQFENHHSAVPVDFYGRHQSLGKPHLQFVSQPLMQPASQFAPLLTPPSAVSSQYTQAFHSSPAAFNSYSSPSAQFYPLQGNSHQPTQHYQKRNAAVSANYSAARVYHSDKRWLSTLQIESC